MYLVDSGWLVFIQPTRSRLVDNWPQYDILSQALFKPWLEVLTSKVALKESHLLEVEGIYHLEIPIPSLEDGLV